MTATPFMQLTDEDTTCTFRWHGGEYIDVGTLVNVREPGIDGDDFHAFDVINVWDYAKGEPRIPRTLAAFQERCDEYIAEQANED